MSNDIQLTLPFDTPNFIDEQLALLTPRDIWVRLNQRLMLHLGEDRRLDYKRLDTIDFQDISKYYSAFSNSPDGGLLIFGANSKGEALGCQKTPSNTLNKLENFHIQMCPLAKPEFKRIPVVINNIRDFCVAIYIPYIGRLVENNKGDAFVRYGDTIHKMSEEEKKDFRSTRQELSYELEAAPFKYPEDFDLGVIQDYCDAFRSREKRDHWTNEEILIDRCLARQVNGKITPLNSLVLLAAKNPKVSIPGCRLRIQRFISEVEGTGGNYNPVVDKWIEGNIVKIISSLPEAMKDVVYNVTWLNAEGKFVTTPEYPYWAWFEAIVNACVHRSYSFSGTEITVKFFPDRLIIESPGGFIPPVNEKTIYSARAARNYHLMDALRNLGYVQMAREGTRRIRDSMKEWGLPEPEFKQEALHGVIVRVVLMNDHITRKRANDRDVAQFFGVEAWKLLDEDEIKIAAFVYRNNSVQVSDVVRLTGRTWQTSKKQLDRLVKKGILKYHPGSYARDPKAHYALRKEREDDVEMKN